MPTSFRDKPAKGITVLIATLVLVLSARDEAWFDNQIESAQSVERANAFISEGFDK